MPDSVHGLCGYESVDLGDICWSNAQPVDVSAGPVCPNAGRQRPPEDKFRSPSRASARIFPFGTPPPCVWPGQCDTGTPGMRQGVFATIPGRDPAWGEQWPDTNKVPDPVCRQAVLDNLSIQLTICRLMSQPLACAHALAHAPAVARGLLLSPWEHSRAANAGNSGSGVESAPEPRRLTGSASIM